MYLNAERWFTGAYKSGLDIDNYRQYMVSHEIGHILGHDHKKCSCKGCRAPVMMQQTLGLHGCTPNTNKMYKKKVNNIFKKKFSWAKATKKLNNLFINI
jgi:hypothetical protein